MSFTEIEDMFGLGQGVAPDHMASSGRGRAPNPVRHDHVAHPNPVHGERPAMLPSHRVGQPRQRLKARTIVVPSGVRK